MFRFYALTLYSIIIFYPEMNVISSSPHSSNSPSTGSGSSNGSALPHVPIQPSAKVSVMNTHTSSITQISGGKKEKNMYIEAGNRLGKYKVVNVDAFR